MTGFPESRSDIGRPPITHEDLQAWSVTTSRDDLVALKRGNLLNDCAGAMQVSQLFTRHVNSSGSQLLHQSLDVCRVHGGAREF
jgi:hypothetical protein